MGKMALKVRSAASELAASDLAPTLSRDEVLARYRRFRGLSRDHLSDAMKLVSRDALLRQARGLGLASGKTLVIDDIDELGFVFDLAIHTAAPDRTRVIDRYARSVAAPPGSEDARLLQAMVSAFFSIVRVERLHPAAGLIVNDIERKTKLWLVDQGLEQSAAPGSLLATRLYPLDDFCMTAGVIVPLDWDLMVEVLDEIPFLSRKSPAQALDDRRFAETLYRVALADGIMDRTRYQPVGGPED